MKLSTRARYALQLMVSVARLGDSDHPVSLDRVAKRTRISRRYLEQLVMSLRKSELLQSVAGRSGGYFLARPAGEIRVGQIIQASIGPVNIVECANHPEVCMSTDVCECRPIYQLLNLRITEVLNEYSLADMADEQWLARVKGQLESDKGLIQGAYRP